MVICQSENHLVQTTSRKGLKMTNENMGNGEMTEEERVKEYTDMIEKQRNFKPEEEKLEDTQSSQEHPEK